MATQPNMTAEIYSLKPPGEASEKDRLDLQHQTWLLTFSGSLHKSILPQPPPPSPMIIVDMGTGSGSWALAMARAHPDARIVATDLNPPAAAIQQDLPLPPNLELLQHDADDPLVDWPFPDGSVTFLHARMLVAGIRDWRRFVSRAFRVLTPGGGRFEVSNMSWPYRSAVDDDKDDDDAAGVVDCHSCSSSSSSSSALIRLGNLMRKGWEEREGVDWEAVHKVGAFMADEGFESVEEETTRWPMGDWSQESERERQMGRNTLENLSGLLGYLGPTMLAGKGEEGDGGMSLEEARKITKEGVEDMRINCLERKYFLNMHIQTAVKP